MKTLYMWLKAFERNMNEPNKREKSGGSFSRKINYYASEMIKRKEGPRLIKCDDMPALQVMGFGQRRLWGCLVERYEGGWGWRGGG